MIFSPQIWYIQSNLIFYGLTISFHRSKEVFVCSLIVTLRCVFWVVPSIRGGGIDSPRPASQRAAAFILTAAMLTTLAAPAFAGTWYIEDGDITVKAGETEGTNKVSQGANQEVEDNDTIIKNREDTASSNTVTINAEDKNDKVEVTLKDVNIDTSSRNKAAVSVTGSGNTTIKLDGDNHLTGGNGIYSNSSGSLTISGGTVTATGGNSTGSYGSGGDGGGGDYSGGGSGIYSGSGDVTISDGTVNAAGGDSGNGNYSTGGNGIYNGGRSGSITISGGTVNAAGGDSGNGNYSAGGDGISGFDRVAISGGTVDAKGGNSGTGDYSNGGSGISNGGRSGSITISGGTVNAAGGNDGNGNYSYGGSGIHSVSGSIDLSGSLELTAKAGKGNRSNGKALSQNGRELDPNTFKDKLAPGADIITKDADGTVIDQVSIPRPVEPEKPVIPEESSSSSDGGSAAPSAPTSPLPGLTVTDKDGQRISYTSTQSGNTLTVCVGRLTASFRISLAALRQLRAEGIEAITFQTILCSTTLSVDELLAMGGEDAEAVLTHRFTDSSLTVG